MRKVLEELKKLDLVTEGEEVESENEDSELCEDFNKFMNGIVLNESSRRKATEETLRPAQEYNRRYAEKPENRIRWSK